MENKTAPVRPPIVVILGHVDHGKTSLLDAIRKSAVAEKEHGGITQAISAYQTGTPKITFIDTPGHEAFTKMRSRGARVADIAILVVAANDSVMPQTIESIRIIQEIKIPYIVVINKIDLPEANFDKVVQDLLRHNVLLENYGGDVPYVKVSAKTGEGIGNLLELIELISQMNNITGDPDGQLEAIVIESRLDKNRGPVATVVVRNGKLVVGKNKVRALIDYEAQQIKEALPGMPVEVMGLEKVPAVGESLWSEEKLVQKRANIANFSLNIILKADTVGSLEAITASLPENINVLEKGTGEITEADILLAKTTRAFILGFNTKASSGAIELAEIEKVIIRTYKIIYELLEELVDAAAGALEPILTEEVMGTAQIVAEFPFEKLKICGVKVKEGRLARGDLVKINELKSKIKEIRVGKEQISKVEAGKECGVFLDPQIDFKLGDAIIAYRVV